MAIRKATFKSTTVLQAFKKSGIKPLNPDVFTDYDFAPSVPTSTAAHVPTSYPTTRLSALPVEDEESEGSAEESDSSDEDYNDSDGDSESESDSDSSTSSDDELVIDNGNDHSPSRPHAPHPTEHEINHEIHHEITNSIIMTPASDQPSHSMQTSHSVTLTGHHPTVNRTITPESFYPSSVINNSGRSRRSFFAISPSAIGLPLSRQQHIEMLEGENKKLSSHVEFLEAHCAMAVNEIRDLKR